MKRTISSLIHGNLKRMLAVTSAIAALLLFAYTAFSFKQAESQASRFVIAHVERLAQAGVNSQSVNEIDREIGRFAQTWEETQDFRVRIDLYLNEKQISHAGQLQPFRYLYSSVRKDLHLLSGETLRVEIQIDLSTFIFLRLMLLIVFEGAILGVFYILMRSMQVSIASVTLPLESKIAWIKEIAGNLPESARGKTTFDHSDISEIDDLGISIGSLTEQITGLEDHLSKVNFDRGRLKMAEHVAHNIKGVIATLQLKVNALPASSEKDRRDLMDCVQSLRDVSAGLLKSKKKERSGEHVEEPAAPIHLLEVVRAAVATKATQYSENGQVDISIESEASAYGLFAAVPAAELKAILSNLIDNSVDAANGLCRIQITLQSVSGQVAISVRDNGRGIPEHILPLLMAEGFSYGKENGNGIGLFHAKEVIEKSQGKIEIHSQEGFGTKINMTLPKAKAPAGFLRSIEIPIGGTVICVDDDSIIHDVLDSKLRQVRNEISQVVHLYSARAFNDWIAANGAGTFGSRIYLFDYDLKDDEGTGLDLIHSHGLAFESVLVSGMVTDRLVAERAAKIGVKCLSKDFLDVVPIVMDAATQPEVRVSEVACLV